MVKISKQVAEYLRKAKPDAPITIVNKQATKGKRKKRWVQHDNDTLLLIQKYKDQNEKVIYEYPYKGGK